MSGCCSSGCTCSSAESKEALEIKEILGTWLKAVTSGTPDAVVTLYADNAIMMPMQDASICRTPAERLHYFEGLTAQENLQVTVDELATRVIGDVGINSGLYTLTYQQNGAPVSVTTRFSFVYKKTCFGWMIINHHASLVPANS